MFDLELFFQPPERPIMPPGQGVSSCSIAPFTGIYLQKHSSMHKEKKKSAFGWSVPSCFRV